MSSAPLPESEITILDLTVIPTIYEPIPSQAFSST